MAAPSHAPCWGLYKAQLVNQPGRNAQSMRHLPHTETLCSPTTNPDAFYRIVPWYRAVAQAHRSGLCGSGSLEPPALRGCVRSLVTTSRTRARKLRLALSSRELGNESTKWGTVRSQRPGDRVSTPRVADDTLADRFDVLVGPIAHQEAWATSKLLLTYGIMRRDSRAGDSLPARSLSPAGPFF